MAGGVAEAAEIVLGTYGEPDEVTATMLVWVSPGPWKRIVATRVFYEHWFPVPHSVAAFDGSVIVERTAGEVSARRRGDPTDPDDRVLSDEDLQRAQQDGEQA